ncbi:ArnT family glycosyltransferase [Arcticibacter tournemirensis]
MALLLLVIFFLALIAVTYSFEGNLLLSILLSTVLTSLFIVLSSEALSTINMFNYTGIVINWVIATTVMVAVAFYVKSLKTIPEIIGYLKELVKEYKLASTFVIIAVLLLLVQGIIYPPNNWDSMTYHMGRIVHWLSNNNIYPFPTSIYRQIYQPPLAEYWIAHICILASSDLFANAVQLFFFVAVIITALEIARELAFSKNAKIFLVLFIASTPEIVLQATSTQNDIVAAFFVLACCLFCIKAYKKDSFWNLLILGIIAGLGCLTKGTVYLYLLPVFLIWGVAMLQRGLKRKKYVIILKLALVPLLITILNSGHYYRNYQISNNFLGNDEQYFNEKQGIDIFFLNVIKNISLHFGVPGLNEVTNKVITYLQDSFRQKIDDPATNWNGTSFKLEKWNLHEDYASNFFHTILIGICFIIILFHYKKLTTIQRMLLLFPFLEFVLFSGLLKWQPWNSRLQVPNFCMFGLMVGYISGDSLIPKSEFFKTAIRLTYVLTLLFSVCVILFNPTRPYIALHKLTPARLSMSREQKYFAFRRDDEQEYFELSSFIKRNINQTGIIMGGDTWEYPLFHDIFSDKSNPKVLPHLKVSNFSKNTPWNRIAGGDKLKYLLSENKSDTIHFNVYIYQKIKEYKNFSIYQREN